MLKILNLPLLFLIRVLWVVNSKFFISAWNEVIQSNGHNFWTVCPMAVKKPKWREFYWLSFALNFSFGEKMHILWPFHCCSRKIFFLTNWKQICIGISIGIRKSNQHELVTWWSWYFSVQFVSKVVHYSCLVFAHFGGSSSNVHKNYDNFCGMCLFWQKQYSISKGRLLPITHTIQI